MQQTSTGSWRQRWLRWRRTVLLSIILGLLQALLLSGYFELSFELFLRLPVWVPIALAAIFYLFISTSAGFLASRQSGNTESGVHAGCLAGSMGILGAVIALVILIAFIAPPPQPPCQPHCHFSLSFPPSLVLLAIAPYITFIEILLALVACLSGGWIGGLVGKRLSDRSN